MTANQRQSVTRDDRRGSSSSSTEDSNPRKGRSRRRSPAPPKLPTFTGKTLASSGPLLYFSLKELQHDTTGPRAKRLTGSWIVLGEKPWSLCGSFDLNVITRF